MKCTATEDDVDVLMSGYVFRLKILHEKGLSLVRKEGKTLSLTYIYTGVLVRLLDVG